MSDGTFVGGNDVHADRKRLANRGKRGLSIVRIQRCQFNEDGGSGGGSGVNKSRGAASRSSRFAERSEHVGFLREQRGADACGMHKVAPAARANAADQRANAKFAAQPLAT